MKIVNAGSALKGTIVAAGVVTDQFEIAIVIRDDQTTPYRASLVRLDTKHNVFTQTQLFERPVEAWAEFAAAVQSAKHFDPIQKILTAEGGPIEHDAT